MMNADHVNDIVTVKQFYAALNRGDTSAALKIFDADVVRVEFEGTSMEGRCRGLAEMEKHIESGRSTWAEGACEPERFSVEGDNIIVFVHVKVCLKDKTEWIDGRVADVFKFRNGKVIEFRSFLENQEATDWAENN